MCKAVIQKVKDFADTCKKVSDKSNSDMKIMHPMRINEICTEKTSEPILETVNKPKYFEWVGKQKPMYDCCIGDKVYTDRVNSSWS